MKAFLKRIAYILVALIAVMIIGTISFSHLQGLSLFDAFYFTIITVATVGFGDITPTNTASKILTILIVLVGVGAFTGLVVSSTQFLIERRTEKQRSNRVNMLVELFFSEVGSELLRNFSHADIGLGKDLKEFMFDAASLDTSLAQFRKKIKGHAYSISPERLKLQTLKDLLEGQAGFLVSLMESPNLTESESIAELLRATFHLRQEFKSRVDLSSLPRTDLEHLANDARRVYINAAPQWIDHVCYLKKNYPYLFSLSLRTNPFSDSASSIVR